MMNYKQIAQELQAENQDLLRVESMLCIENKNYRRGVNIVYRWLRGDYPFNELSQSEIESMLEKLADIPQAETA